MAASGGLDVEVQLTSDGPWIGAVGGAFHLTCSGHGLVASVFRQMGGGREIAATGGASQQRNGGQELGSSG